MLVPRLPHIQGFTDACKYGAGGVWIIPLANGTNRYIYWAVDFPQTVIDQFEARHHFYQRLGNGRRAAGMARS